MEQYNSDSGPHPLPARENGVVLLLNSLSGGGAERAVLTLAAHSRFECAVLAEWRGGELSGDPLAERVEYVSEGEKRPSRPVRVARLAAALRRRKPRAVVSVLSPAVHVAASKAAGVPCVHWFQNPPSARFDLTGSGIRARAHRASLRMIARHTAALVPMAPAIGDELTVIGIQQSHLTVLPNPVDVKRIPLRRGDGPQSPATLITVGRLWPQKRQDLLLSAVAKLAPQRDIRLAIVGTGPLEADLRRQAAQLGIADLVEFTGWVDRPHELVARSDLFVLSSDYEGGPVALLEALACGVPVLTTDAPYGPRYLLGGISAGELVRTGSAEALAGGIARMLDRRPFTEEIRMEARARAEEFSAEQVAGRLDHLLARVCLDSRQR